MSEVAQRLYRAAAEAAPRSFGGVECGAAVLTANGKLYAGCNVSISKGGLDICAERAAILNAVSEGERSFAALGVIG